MQKLNEHVKIAEASRILGVSQNTVRAWADDGTVPAMINRANSFRLFRWARLNGRDRRIDGPTAWERVYSLCLYVEVGRPTS